MSKQGTKYILSIDIESVRGEHTSDIDFGVSFYVYAHKRIRLEKRDLIRSTVSGCTHYYAIVDSEQLGCGVLRCEITIQRSVSVQGAGTISSILAGNTGVVIGNDSYNGAVCFGYTSVLCDEGYKVMVAAVHDIPKDESAYVYYGVVSDPITSFSEINETHLAALERISARSSASPYLIQVSQGEKVVVLVPSGIGLYACKDNGMRGMVLFDDTILGANGEIRIELPLRSYDVYGEISTASGMVSVYVIEKE